MATLEDFHAVTIYELSLPSEVFDELTKVVIARGLAFRYNGGERTFTFWVPESWLAWGLGLVQRLKDRNNG